jgi:hypothetical protein
MTTLIHQRVEAARAGSNPTVICHRPSTSQGHVAQGQSTGIFLILIHTLIL